MSVAIILLAAGSNARGQLASGATDDVLSFSPAHFLGYPPSQLPNGVEKILDLASGANHTLLLLSHHHHAPATLWGCGDGQRGQLGPFDYASPWTAFRQIDILPHLPSLQGHRYRLIAASWETSYVVFSHPNRSDVLISMGANDFGDLGAGSLSPEQLKQAFHFIRFGHIPIDGISLDDCHFTFETLRAGPHHVVATLKVEIPNTAPRIVTVGWGAARHGQLDVDGIFKRVRQYDKPRLLFIDPLGQHVIQVGLGNQHTVLVRSSGQLIALGSNAKGQIQHLDDFKDVLNVQCTWNGTYVIRACEGKTPTIHATGSNSHHQLGSGDNCVKTFSSSHVLFQSNPLPVHRLLCGSEHVVAWLGSGSDDTEIWGWGWNEHGNLGTSTTEDVPSPLKIWPIQEQDQQYQVTGIWAGCATTWIAIGLTKRPH